MCKYTPGPWEAVLSDDPRGQPVPHYRALIALVSQSPHLSIVAAQRDTVPRQEWEGNARIIAAAPEMHAALCAAVEFGSHGEACAQDDGDCHCWLRFAVAALEKAGAPSRRHRERRRQGTT